jgi:predicted transcriptional regulator
LRYICGIEGGDDVTTKKQATSYRLSTTARDLLRELAMRSGHSQSAVLETAVRELAKKEGLKYE